LYYTTFQPIHQRWIRLLCSASEAVQAFRLTYYAPRDIFANVIRSFSCKDTQALFEGRCPLRFRSVQRIAERKLAQLDAAQTLEFLRSPPGNHLEKLSGDRRGQWSIRINDQWRVCFVWDENGPCAVEIVDYH